MADNDWKKRLGVVYSTNPDFQYTEAEEEQVKTLTPSSQRLIVSLDRRARAGKQVTLVKGFVGSEEDLAALGKSLKVKCGVGGTAKDGEITLQGDLRDKVVALLQSMSYKAKRVSWCGRSFFRMVFFGFLKASRQSSGNKWPGHSSHTSRL